MKDFKVRVRFAPAPTGAMHLGNIRTALFNYLFAHKKNGALVLRIEDTDPQRNFDPDGKHIIADLKWLNIIYDEGPGKEGNCGPYFQSKRTKIYQKKLNELTDKKLAYRCFCTKEELDKKRQRQIFLKQPPRYDRACLELSEEEAKAKLKQNIPFIWRIKLDHSQKITVNDIAHGKTTYDLKNFSDFPLTRQNGSFTFMFANCIDDIDMKITHVFRGEDHTTNTAGQTFLYQLFGAPLPEFWHMPIICNVDGKKLSKRDFGFSLKELIDEGFLPEAIINYLGIIGGSFEKEVLSLDQLAETYDFQHISTTSQIKYDIDKLKWVNHKWLAHYDTQKLAKLCQNSLEEKFPQIKELSQEKIYELIELAKPEITTLNEVPKHIEFYFEEPKINKEVLVEKFDLDLIQSINKLIENNLSLLSNPENFINKIKSSAKENNLKIGGVFQLIRLLLIGKIKGPGILELLTTLGKEKSQQRLRKIC